MAGNLLWLPMMMMMMMMTSMHDDGKSSIERDHKTRFARNNYIIKFFSLVNFES